MQRAIRNRAPAQALIFHSDCGSEYGAYRYRAILTQHGIRPSVNRPRCCQDNAHMESFFHTMKTEWIRGRAFATFAELEAALKAYIRFCNHHRLHSSIEYHTPAEYERLVESMRDWWREAVSTFLGEDPPACGASAAASLPAKSLQNDLA